jgi:D-amino-acid dehydrogenase
VAHNVIVGGGIIGTAIAFALQRDGHNVTIVEPDDLGTGAAAGSAGYISVGEIFPLASPDVVWNTPRMLFDPLGPLAIDPRYLFKLVPWGLRFLAAARPSRRERGIDALASLNRDATTYLERLARDAGIDDLLSLDGGLLVCRDVSSLRRLQSHVPVLESHGIRVEVLDAAQLRKLEPALKPQLAGALLFPDSARCADPRAFGVRLGERIVRDGAAVARAKATALRPLASGAWEVITANDTLKAERVIVATGVWSGQLLDSLGYRVPIETERGYHLMLPEPRVELYRPMVFEEAHFCATPMNGGLRLAGTVEFAGTHAPMNPRRSDILFDLASQYIEGLHLGMPSRWMGFRPSLPDSLPAIGASARHANLFYCFGHQHLGLTQAAISARCIADLVARRRPPIDLAPFDLRRFEGGVLP